MTKKYLKNFDNLKIGLFGGSFNPPHFGHVFVAKQAIKNMQLDQVWLLFCKKNPLKSAKYQNAELRMQMTKELIGYNKKIKVIDTDDIYTYKTLRDFKKKFTRCKFTWIMGMDSLKNFHLWDKWQEIAKRTKIAVFDRGKDLHTAVRSKAAVKFLKKNQFNLLFTKKQNISSTEMRGN